MHSGALLKAVMITALSTALIFVTGCKKDSPTETPDPDALQKRSESAHFIYYSAADDTGIDTLWQERFYGWLSDQLAVTNTEKFNYYKYRDRNHILKLTGKNTNGFADPKTLNFYTIWKVDNHEFTHAFVTRKIGHPPALFNEGIAVAYQATYNPAGGMVPSWNGQDYHTLAKGFKNNGTLPTLTTLLGYNSFWSVDAGITYPVAGSFVRYLITTYGVTKLKTYISGAAFTDNETKIRSDVFSVYGVPLDSLWGNWERFIAAY